MAIHLDIVTPSGAAYQGEVEGIVLPGSEGDFGVLPDHERFLCPLRIGEVQIQTSGQMVYAAIAEGFADVSAERVAVLVESCELSSGIDTARAQAALERATRELEALDASGDEAFRVAEFEAAVGRAKNRLEVSQRG